MPEPEVSLPPPSTIDQSTTKKNNTNETPLSPPSVSPSQVKKEKAAANRPRPNFLKKMAKFADVPMTLVGYAALIPLGVTGLVLGAGVGEVVKMLPKKTREAFVSKANKYNYNIKEGDIVGPTAGLGMKIGGCLALYACTALGDYGDDKEIKKFMNSGLD